MICRQNNCLFVHIPKTAGQSIEKFFLDLPGNAPAGRKALLLRRRAHGERGPERLAHLTASEYVDFGFVDRDAFDGFFKFSFVRNPWDRLVSEYRFRYARKFTFKDFVFRHMPPVGMTNAYRHVMPQHEFIFDSNGQLLVDYLGRFENLDSDFGAILTKLGLGAGSLPHINSTSRLSGLRSRLRACLRPDKSPRLRAYSDYFDDETREFVGQLYARDIELLGYTFA